MTTKEKAEDLVDKFMGFKLTDYKDPEMGLSLFKAKRQALICIDEIQEHAQMVEGEYEGYTNTWYYFTLVKKEIEKL